jgi:hypothetical protein
MESGALRRVDPAALDRRLSRILPILLPGQFGKSLFDGLVTIGVLLLLELPQLV